MSAELKAISNIMSGVSKSTGKGQAGMSKISRSFGKVASDKKKKAAAEERKKERESKRKENEEKRASSKPKASKPKASKPAASKPSTKTSAPSKKPDYSKKVVQPSLPGMSKAKLTADSPKSSTKTHPGVEETFTPTAKKKSNSSQPSLPGMSPAKLKSL